jgi:hypothetical protein
MNIGESVLDVRNSLRVNLIDFDSIRGKGHIKIDDLSTEKVDSIVVVKFGSGGDNRIKHEPRNPNYIPIAEISTTTRNDYVSEVQFISLCGA